MTDCKQLIVNEKSITVYDGLLSRSWMAFAFDFVQSSLFRIGWADTTEHSLSNHRYLHADYSVEDVKRLQLLEQIQHTGVGERVQDLTVDRCVANLSIPGESHFAHTHDGITLLYYPNLRWAEEWAGETQFYSEDLKEVAYTSLYTPGRVILFDGAIPHTLRPQSAIAPMYRFTITVQFSPTNH